MCMHACVCVCLFMYATRRRRARNGLNWTEAMAAIAIVTISLVAVNEVLCEISLQKILTMV